MRDAALVGECGSVKLAKLKDLAGAFPSTKFSVAKWGRSTCVAMGRIYGRSCPAIDRNAPFELLNFPSTAVENFPEEAERSPSPMRTFRSSISSRMRRMARADDGEGDDVSQN